MSGPDFPRPFESLPADGGRWHLIAEAAGRRYHIGRAQYSGTLEALAEPLPGVRYFLADRTDSGLLHGDADALREAVQC